MIRQIRRFFSVALLVIVGCSTNPVTGKEEVRFISATREIEMGQTHYQPLQQASGGIYQRDPKLTAYVQSIVDRLAAVSDRPELPYEIVIIDTDTINAWALPGGKMAVHRGLLSVMKSEAELAAVLGHEMVHAVARHSARQMERNSIFLAGLAIADLVLTDNDNRTLILAGASAGTHLLSLKYSRKDESEADHYGMIYMARAGYDPAQAVSLQQTFVALSKAQEENTGPFDSLFATHPPSEDRVKANQALAKTLEKDLFIGESIYQKKTALLQRDTPAYALLAEGQAALIQDNLALAKEKAAAASAINTDLYQYHYLLGQIAYAESAFSQAAEYYRTAISLHSDYYLLYYEYGLALEALKDYTAAQAAYERSWELLESDETQKALTRVKKEIYRQNKKARLKSG